MTIKRFLLTIFIGDREKWRELNEARKSCKQEIDKELSPIISKLVHIMSKLIERKNEKL